MAGLNVKVDAMMRFFEAAAALISPFDPFPPRSPSRESSISLFIQAPLSVAPNCARREPAVLHQAQRPQPLYRSLQCLLNVVSLDCYVRQTQSLRITPVLRATQKLGSVDVRCDWRTRRSTTKMQGKSEFEVTGNLKDWERWDVSMR